MARQASVREKNGYWYSNAKGLNRYFGKCSAVTYTQALSSLYATLAEAESKAESTREAPSPPQSLPVVTLTPIPAEPTVDSLADAFLQWLGKHRPAKAHRERSRHLNRFRERNGKALASSLGSTQLEAFGESLRFDGHAPLYVHKHIASVRMMMGWGVKYNHLPQGFNPFAHAEPVHVPAKPLLESDLPSRGEVRLLIAHAQADLADMLRVYHATGARTHELMNASVGDFQPSSRTVVLGKHKQSHTLREPIPRTIMLSPIALSIIKSRCEGRDGSEALFIRDTGERLRWTSEAITQRFQRIRAKAGVRPHITIYSFRHLWISEALMIGLDALLVARMAGTSVLMLEKVYGHFKTSTFAYSKARLDASRLSCP